MPKSVNALTSTIQEDIQSNSVRERTDHFIATLRQVIIQHGLKWHAPTISYDESDDTTDISWWRENKSLIITVEPENPISYLKVWGPNIHSEMEEGQDTSSNHLLELWQWLYA